MLKIGDIVKCTSMDGRNSKHFRVMPTRGEAALDCSQCALAPTQVASAAGKGKDADKYCQLMRECQFLVGDGFHFETAQIVPLKSLKGR
jgi:hypothetical protein